MKPTSIPSMLTVGSIAVAATVGWFALAPVGHPADGSAEPTAGSGSSASNSSGNGNSRDIANIADARLVTIIEAWGHLPEFMRRSILAMIETEKDGE